MSAMSTLKIRINMSEGSTTDDQPVRSESSRGKNEGENSREWLHSDDVTAMTSEIRARGTCHCDGIEKNISQQT